MSIYIVTNDELTNTADAIRQKAGTAAELEWEQGNGFKEVIEAIPSGDQIEIASVDAVVIPPQEGTVNITLDLSTIAIAAVSGEVV